MQYYINNEGEEVCQELHLLISVLNKDFSHPLFLHNQMPNEKFCSYSLPSAEVNIDRVKTLFGVTGEYLLEGFYLD